MIRSVRVLAAGFVLAGLGPVGAAQTAVSLSKPDARYAEPLTRVTAIRELPGNKVLVADLQEKIVQLIDLGAGTAVKVGREGQGPGEYGMPGPMIALPNGQTLLYDVLGRHFLTIGVDGKPGATLSLPGSGGFGIFGGDMRGDAQGRVYFTGQRFNLNGGPAPDSVPVMRWSRVGTKFDTIAWLGVPRAEVTSDGGGGRVSVRIGNSKVFTPEEQWAVSGDGRVARVRPSPYQVIWYDGPGKVTQGSVVPYTPLKVTEADKQEVIDQQKKQKPMVIAIGGGGRAAPPPNLTLPPPQFAETKPPFTGAAGLVGSVAATPEGEVWVLRTRPAGEKTPLYDVFDRAGKLVRKVSLNPNSRVVGFGAGTVYVVRTDEDDLQYLERYRR